MSRNSTNRELDASTQLDSGVIEETARLDESYTLIPLEHLASVKLEAEDERPTKEGAVFWSAGSRDPCGTRSALGGVRCQRFRNGASHLSRRRGAGIPAVR